MIIFKFFWMMYDILTVSKNGCNDISLEAALQPLGLFLWSDIIRSIIYHIAYDSIYTYIEVCSYSGVLKKTDIG